jgi:hypothetical protein
VKALVDMVHELSEGPRHGPSHSPTLGSGPGNPGRSSIARTWDESSRPPRGGFCSSSRVRPRPAWWPR